MMITDNIFPLQAIKCTILSPSLGPKVEEVNFVKLDIFDVIFVMLLYFTDMVLPASSASLLANLTNFPVIMKHLGTSSSNQFMLVPISYIKFNYLGRLLKLDMFNWIGNI